MRAAEWNEPRYRPDPDEDGPVGIDELGDLVFPTQVGERRVVGHREHPVPGWREDYDVPVFEAVLPDRWINLAEIVS